MRGIHLGNDECVEAGQRTEHAEIVFCVGRGDGVDACCDFTYRRGPGERGEVVGQRLAGVGLLVRRD